MPVPPLALILRELVSCARIINAGIIQMIAVFCPEDCQPFVLNRCLGFKLCFVISAQFPRESCPSCWQPFSLARKLTGVRRPLPGYTLFLLPLANLADVMLETTQTTV